MEHTETRTRLTGSAVAVRVAGVGDGQGPIVVGVDGSPRAERVLTAAIDLAKATGRVLEIVYAYRPIGVPVRGLPTELRAMLSPHLTSDTVLTAARVRARAAGVTAHVNPVEGSAARALVATARATNASTIVVGNRGARGWHIRAVDRVPRAVAHRAPCTVFVVDSTRPVTRLGGVT